MLKKRPYVFELIVLLDCTFLLPLGAVASWLECSTPDRVVRVKVLPGDIVLCSWERHFTPTGPLSTQVYKWVPPKCWGYPCNGLGGGGGGKKYS